MVLLFQMMEDFSGLALPPLFGEHILEAELEPGGVELGPGEVILSNMGQMLTVVRESYYLRSFLLSPLYW